MPNGDNSAMSDLMDVEDLIDKLNNETQEEASIQEEYFKDMKAEKKLSGAATSTVNSIPSVHSLIYLVTWTLGHLARVLATTVTWTLGHLDTWLSCGSHRTLGHLAQLLFTPDTWTLGHLDTRTQTGHLDACVPAPAASTR